MDTINMVYDTLIGLSDNPTLTSEECTEVEALVGAIDGHLFGHDYEDDRLFTTAMWRRTVALKTAVDARK